MEREEGAIGEEWRGRWKTMTDGEKDSSRDGWMDDGGKVDFGITLCSIRMNMNGSMLPHSPQGQIPISIILLPQKIIYLT